MAKQDPAVTSTTSVSEPIDWASFVWHKCTMCQRLFLSKELLQAHKTSEQPCRTSMARPRAPPKKAAPKRASIAASTLAADVKSKAAPKRRSLSISKTANPPKRLSPTKTTKKDDVASTSQEDLPTSTSSAFVPNARPIQPTTVNKMASKSRLSIDVEDRKGKKAKASRRQSSTGVSSAPAKPTVASGLRTQFEIRPVPMVTPRKSSRSLAEIVESLHAKHLEDEKRKKEAKEADNEANKQSSSSVVKLNPVEPAKAKTRTKHYRCNQCHNLYPDVAQVMEHISKEHPRPEPEKVYRCNQCTEFFSDVANLMEHLCQKHPPRPQQVNTKVINSKFIISHRSYRETQAPISANLPGPRRMTRTDLTYIIQESRLIQMPRPQADTRA